jgi:hypothetical protein
MISRALALLPILAVLSCSTAPKMDPLEAKAAEGDPAAACQFAARNIHACALEKQKWERGELTDPPACLDDPAGAKAEAYLDKTEAKLKSDPAKGSEVAKLSVPVLFMANRVLLGTSELVVMVGKADKAVETTADLEQHCSKLDG